MKAKRKKQEPLTEARESDPPLRLVRHRTIGSLMQAYFTGENGETFPLEELKTAGFGALTVDSEGNHGEREFTFDQFAATIRREGFWGFATPKQGCVHVWVSRRANPFDVAFFLGHEVGHTQGRTARSHLSEEIRADRYGVAARQALRWLVELGAVPELVAKTSKRKPLFEGVDSDRVQGEVIYRD